MWPHICPLRLLTGMEVVTLRAHRCAEASALPLQQLSID
jgi:hypothetical protein